MYRYIPINRLFSFGFTVIISVIIRIIQNERFLKTMLTLEKFEEASEIVRKVTADTKLVYSEYFSSLTGNKVYFKPENM